MNVQGRGFVVIFAAFALLFPLRLLAGDAASAYTEGQAFGSAQKSSSASVSGFDSSKVPNYNTNPPQTGLYGGSSLFQPGVDKINNCASYTPGSNAVENQECEAVNFLAKNPSQRINVSIPTTDPIRSANVESATNPKDVLKRFGMDFDGNPGVCHEVTRVTDVTYRNEICYETVEVETLSCSVGRTVVVDADSNYLCNQTYQAIDVVTCRKQTTPVLNLQQNCVDGRAYSSSGIRDGWQSWDEVTLDYICNSTQATGPIPIQMYAHGLMGACIGPLVSYVDFTNVTDWITGPDLSPHWEGYCQDTKTKYRVTQACSAQQPSCQVQMYWWQEYCREGCPDGYTRQYTDGNDYCWNGESAIPLSNVCNVYRSSTLTLSFTHPSEYRASVTFDNGCAALEQRSL